MSRVARITAQGYPHHITQRGTNRTAIFIDDEDRTYFLSLLNKWLERTATKAWAYCLMTNHFHLLLEPSDEVGLGKCMHGATFQYAQYFNTRYKRTGRLWENRYFSCPVDKEAYLWAVIRYIENNPVRAGISGKANDWKWSSCTAHINGVSDGDLKIYNYFNSSERTDYAGYLEGESEIEDEKIRKATSTGRPFGNDAFISLLEERLNRNVRISRRGRPRKE
jgi:putative transposase